MRRCALFVSAGTVYTTVPLDSGNTCFWCAPARIGGGCIGLAGLFLEMVSSFFGETGQAVMRHRDIIQFWVSDFGQFTQKLCVSIDFSVGIFYNKNNWNSMNQRSDSCGDFDQIFMSCMLPARNTGRRCRRSEEDNT